MQTQQVDIGIPLQPPPAGPDRLPPLERLRPPRAEARGAPAGEDDATAAASFAVPVIDDGPGAVITVRYALDQVARTWVTHVFDAHTGDLLRAVPSTEYHHQMAVLAALRAKTIDTRA